jgi:hypothetical protein
MSVENVLKVKNENTNEKNLNKKILNKKREQKISSNTKNDDFFKNIIGLD